MRLPLVALVVVSFLGGASGCNDSPRTTGTGASVDKHADSQGWKTESEANQDLNNGDTTYGSYDAKRGQHVRATASAQPEPVDMRLYVVDLHGKETTLAEKKKAAEAVLKGEVPYDSTLMLSIRLDSGKQTSCKYKIERR